MTWQTRPIHRGRRSAVLSLWASGLACCWMAAGCATFREEQDALTRYERTREEMRRAAEGPTTPPVAETVSSQSLSLSDFAPENVKGTVSRLTGGGPKPEEADRLYNEAKTIYNEALALRDKHDNDAAAEKFRDAADKFREAGKKLPKSSVEQNGLF
ncbi:MAG: hypothetical protein AB7F89_25740, partial [Pirellulaceae bacterium]